MALQEMKKEEISDDENDTVACRICSKAFLTSVALNNHARTEHVEIYLASEPSAWTLQLKEENPNTTQVTQTKKQAKAKYYHKYRPPNDDEAKLIRKKTEELVSSMEPTSLTTLASEDVSYIIIKADPSDLMPRSPVKKKKLEKGKSEQRREVQPITGPFECLQPSNLVRDRTCHQIFFSCCEYSVHYRDEHTRRRKGLRCQVCEKPLACSNPEDGLPYSCDLCGAGFPSCEALETHIGVAHVKQKPYECSVCHKKFTQKGGVQQHMRMHTGDKPYSCSFCPKSFTQKSGLAQHLRIHTKIKPYRCVICSKAFCQSIHLKQHMRTHTNVSPFQCGICQKRFKQSSHLNYHLRYHDPATLTDEQRQKYAELIGLIGTQPADDLEQECFEGTMMEQEANQEVVVGAQHETQYIVLTTESDWCVQ